MGLFYIGGMSRTVVETRCGRVEGEARGGHVAFRGIPFAKPPVDQLRFRAPEPMEPWSGVRSARVFGAASLQGAAFAMGTVAEGQSAEDCLYLNVYTPAHASTPRAVFVFIHGGAFTVGSASQPMYDGAALSERNDIVVVTTNYRVGALGYLSLGDAGRAWGAVENRGSLDQLAALRWVHENIAAFGGDPENVTICGESAGATSVCLLLAMPEARGLFARAVSQSSPDSLGLPTPEQCELNTRALLGSLDLSLASSERLLEVPVAAIMQAQHTLESDGRWPHFYPVQDPLFGGQPRESIATGKGSQVPLIIGSNRDEWNLFAAVKIAEWAKPLEDHDLIARVSKRLPAGSADAAASIVDTYRNSRRERALPYGNRALLRAIDGDRVFRIPSLRFAELYRERVPDTYVYLFSYESPGMRGALGACHGLELPFVFGTWDRPEQERFAGTGEAVAQLSKRMIASWGQFAKIGQPTTQDVPNWPRYELARRATLELDLQTRLVDDPYGAERRVWDDLI